MTRTAILGGSFDPPGRHHRDLAALLERSFDRVAVVPQGNRPDRGHPIDTTTIARATMADITFRGLPKTTVELFDLEDQTFSQPYQLDHRFKDSGELWHVVPAQLLRGGAESPIRQHWTRGAEFLADANFVVVKQRNEPLDGIEMPRHFEVVEVEPFLPAEAIRNLVFNRESTSAYLLPEVEHYIRRHRLYRGAPPARESQFRVERPRFRLVFDEQNEKAQRIARQLGAFVSDEPELIVVLGGDGTMLRAIRQFWRERLPFYGLNTGHLGFLLNSRSVVDESAQPFWERDLSLYQLPLLWAEAQSPTGERKTGYAFNEVWAERATGQTAWVRLSINGQERIGKLVCDGALVSTAAGSSSYARAMGASPIPFYTPVLILAGSNVLFPTNWRNAILPNSAEVEIATLDPVKRPLKAFMDGVPFEEIASLRVRASHTASVEIAFHPEHDPIVKLTNLQFPTRSE